MATWDDVRELGLALPGVEESTSYRQPSLKVGGRAFATMSPHEDGALVLRVDPDELPLIVASDPRAFYVTPHYEGHPLVLVRLESIEREELADRMTDSWLLAAPKRLADALDP